MPLPAPTAPAGTAYPAPGALPSATAAAVSLASDLESTCSSRCNVALSAVRESIELVSNSNMGSEGRFSKILVYHPWMVLLAVAVFSASFLVIPLVIKKLPSFSDPTLGFETRGTIISQRLTAWQNVLKEIRPSGFLTENPKSLEPPISTPFPVGIPVTAVLDSSSNGKKRRKNKNRHQNYTFGINVSEAEEDSDTSDVWRNIRKSFKNSSTIHPIHITRDGFFCSSPSRDYSHVVISSTKREDLLSLDALIFACKLDKHLRENQHFSLLCTQSPSKKCCHSWALHNYVALINGRQDCLEITNEDVQKTREILRNCSGYYHNLRLKDNCDIFRGECSSLPLECIEYDAVYNIMHYLVDTNFLSPNNSSNEFVSNEMLFLPIAYSSKILPYYQSLNLNSLTVGNVKVTAMDFGLKSTLFDESLVRDTWLIGLGAFSVFLCMLLYTNSFFVTCMTIIAIGLALGISYFCYTIIFEMHFFPFMNLLACVVAVGIGADDAFILCKVWSATKAEKANASLVHIVDVTLNHAFSGMIVTSITTAVAFFSSFVSSITAIRCFSVFAGTATLANLLLMLTWVPATILITEHWNYPFTWAAWNTFTRKINFLLGKMQELWNTAVVFLVIRLPYLWLLVLGPLALGGVVIVLYYPGLRLPDSPDFQLFDRSHLFEQYDFIYRDYFRFERLEKHTISNMNLPLRFVWGVKAIDTGDYLNPFSRGELKLDPTFDLADVKSQEWLKEFCHNVKNQSFYLPTPMLIPSCFIETLGLLMDRRCNDTIDNIDRSPCCETTPFPYARPIFNKCAVQAAESMYRTPHLFSGRSGPKFSKNLSNPLVQALVVEYDSSYIHTESYQDMHSFYSKVESWMQEQLRSAPPGMRNGWFISDFQFYDVQKALLKDTVTAIAVSMSVSLVVLLVSTLNLFVSIFAIISVNLTIFVTISALISLGWELNVLESIAVSTAIGLSTDFSVHYSAAYRHAPDNSNRVEAVRFALLRMTGPTAMGAFTTAVAGLFMLLSSVLAYIKIGVFLLVLMTVSWIYSTFFLMSILRVAGPQHGYGQFSYPKNLNFFKNRSPNLERSVKVNVLSESTLSASSVSYPLHASVSVSDTHELEALTRLSRK